MNGPESCQGGGERTSSMTRLSASFDSGTGTLTIG